MLYMRRWGELKEEVEGEEVLLFRLRALAGLMLVEEAEAAGLQDLATYLRKLLNEIRRYCGGEDSAFVASREEAEALFGADFEEVEGKVYHTFGSRVPVTFLGWSWAKGTGLGR